MGLADAVVIEVLDAMRNQGIATITELGRQVGWRKQYVHERLGTGSPRTGRRVVLTIRDVEELAVVLNTRASILVARAEVRNELGETGPPPQ